MYKCQQCEGEAEVQGVQAIDQNENPTIDEVVVCKECSYTISRDAADKADLLEACKEALRALRVVYDNTNCEDLLARLDCWPLTELREAVAKAEKEE